MVRTPLPKSSGERRGSVPGLPQPGLQLPTLSAPEHLARGCGRRQGPARVDTCLSPALNQEGRSGAQAWGWKVRGPGPWEGGAAELRSGSSGATAAPWEAGGRAGAALQLRGSGAGSYLTGSCNQPWGELCCRQGQYQVLNSPPPPPPSHHERPGCLSSCEFAQVTASWFLSCRYVAQRRGDTFGCEVNKQDRQLNSPGAGDALLGSEHHKLSHTEARLCRSGTSWSSREQRSRLLSCVMPQLK